MRPVAALALLWLVVVPVTALGKALPAAAIAGFWRTEGGEAIIRIDAHAGHFPGRLAWLAEDHYPADDDQGMGGQPVVDRHNPDPAKRNRRLLGLKIIKNLDYHVGDDQQAHWVNGRIYDTERGKWFDCRIQLADRDHLKLRGYIGLPVLGRTTTWTRVPDPNQHPPPRRSSSAGAS
ncbi:DUF2147 domain-containing protein [Salinisphaera sp. Q1T1-3]|uniref:DUF2147 domain-containing protein n=1 Tax=Salinisphaera sp. Q1T1-3 TaxID=2321229 RepID=UPI000E736A0E|nr:DUF2147 domain-containing protein [Salinisphaera sp. Q1T1-3]RJS93965.1 DUF2147 domain-containing protein [Salinisphaera sp. Q1T1-3]